MAVWTIATTFQTAKRLFYSPDHIGIVARQLSATSGLVPGAELVKW